MTARILLLVSFLICVAFMLFNAVLYFADSGGGLALFGAVWCGVMALCVLVCMRDLNG